MPRPKAQLLPLTGVRWFLALWVVIFHETAPDGFLGSSLPLHTDILYSLLRTGYIAVSFFFVLSGFILSYNYSLEKRWSSSQLVRFGVARFARIYPAYCVGLIMMAPFVGYLVATDFSAVTLARQTTGALLNAALLQAWIPRAALSWNAPGWSLSNEAFFYCCFPFAGVALWKLSRRRGIVVAGSLLWAAMLIAPLVAVCVPVSGYGNIPSTSVHLNTDLFWTNLLKFDPLLRIPDFFIGILIARAYQELSRGNSRLIGRGYYFYVPGLVLEILAISQCKYVPYPLVHNGLLTPLHALVILGFALGGGTVARLLATRPLVFLGNASYSMYILHSPTSRWINTIAEQCGSTKLRGIGVMAFYVMVVMCLSAIVLWFIEEPGNRILKKKLLPWLDAPRIAPRPRSASRTASP